MYLRDLLAKVSFLRRKTNNTQAPGLDTPRCVTLGGLYTAAERIQPAEQEQKPGEGVGVTVKIKKFGRGPEGPGGTTRAEGVLTPVPPSLWEIIVGDRGRWE